MTATWTVRVRTAVLGGLLAAAGSAGFVAALPASDLVAPVGTGAAVGAVAAVAGVVHRRAGGEAVQLLGFVALVLLGTVVALGEAPAVLSEAWGADGWPTIRDAPSPAPATPETLAVPYLVTAVAAYLGTSRSLQSGWGALSWAPSLLAMVLGYVLGDEWQSTSLAVPSAWAALVLLSARWHSRPAGSRQVATTGSSQRGAPDLATGAASTVLLVLIVVAAVPAGQQVPLDTSRWILPRAATPAPAVSAHPLLTMVELRNGPDDVLFTAETSAPVSRWRLTVLDDYDGQGWSSTQEFRPAATRLPVVPDGTPRASSEVDQTIELNMPAGPGELAWGRWLPAADGVLATSQDGLLFDTGSETLMAPEGEVPRRYDATSAVGPADDGPRADARAATDAAADATSQLPQQDEPFEELGELTDLAEEITASASSDYDRAVGIQSHLLTNGELLVGEEAPSGHALSHIHDFLLGGEAAEGGIVNGTAEQFATAFVVLARAAGLPSRVVVGFEGGGTTGPQQVTAHDATAWVEVRFDELGWLAFDAVPDPTSDVLPPEPQAASPQEDLEATEPPDDSEIGESPGDDPNADEGGSDGSSDRERSRPWSRLTRIVPGPVALTLVLAAVGLSVAAAPGLKRSLRRRRRRSAPSPADQIAGAWATVVDDLRASGLTVRGTMAVTALTRTAAGQLPARAAEEIVELGALANKSTFAHQPPVETNAARAWELSTSIVKTRRASRPPRRRLREYFTW